MKTLAAVLLIVLPFSPILSNFSPYTSNHTFVQYLIACLLYSVVLLLLALYLSSKRKSENLTNGSLVLVSLGIVIAPPLMLGTPEYTHLLERVTEEHFRYGMLIVSVLLFMIGAVQVTQRISAKSYHWIVLFVIVVSGLWDNISSFRLNEAMELWIADGNQPSDFFAKYNFHEMIRTGGRTLLYVFVVLIGFELYKTGQLKKWVWVSLSIFSLVGIVFYFLFNFVNAAFYFPFMIPAIAMAPVYWLGIYLLTSKRI